MSVEQDKGADKMSAKTWIPYVAAAVFALALVFSRNIFLIIIGLLIGIPVVLLTSFRFRFRIALGFGVLLSIATLVYRNGQYNAGQGRTYELGLPPIALVLPGAVFDFVVFSTLGMAVASLWRLGRHLLRRRSSNVSS